jgi:1,2-dihydroxy-3-keto-5-methylthiopentene dioxygenase
MSEAWIMRKEITDQREENRQEPNVPVSYEQLSDLGVSVFRFDSVTMLLPGENGAPSKLDALAKRMHFANRDEVQCSPDHLPEYDAKLKMFFTEHIHEDDEIRLVKAGSGYFDVRSPSDDWVRIWCKAGDLIIIPAGIYHRFTMDVANYTHAIRLFSELPKWTPINRPCDENVFRARWVEKYGRPGGPVRETIFGAPTENGDDDQNVYIQYPSKFDATIRPLMQKVSETNGKSLLVIYFTGEDLPSGPKESWCPDCVKAKPTLRREIERVRAKFAAAGGERKLYFVQAGINRAAYLGNPEYLYRKHPFCRITGGVPTVLVMVGDQVGEGFEKQRLDGDVPEDWILKED